MGKYFLDLLDTQNGMYRLLLNNLLPKRSQPILSYFTVNLLANDETILGFLM